MKRTLLRVLIVAGMMAASGTAGLGAQPIITRTPGPQQTRQTAPAPQTVEVVVDQRSAQEVREMLMELLRNYPPSLAQVIRLDPTLLTREGYLTPYPTLATFVSQHPEIVLQPAYYFGSPNQNFNEENSVSRVTRGVVDMVSYVTALAGFLGFFLLVGWIVRLVIDHRRWLKATRTQTEVHAKLFDRLTSNEDLLAYIQTPSGQHFLQAAPIPLEAAPPRAIGAPVNRILWSVQAGTILAVVGLGLWVAKNNVIEEMVAPLYVVAILVISLGVGFALSAGLAYLLSLRLGLLEAPKT